MSAGFKHVGPDATYSLTVYPCLSNSLPVGAIDQYQDLSFNSVVALVAPGDTPRVMKNNRFLKCFSSGLLSYGAVPDGARRLLTKAAGMPITHGFARCKNCCQGPFNLLLYDIDGATEHAFIETRGKLGACGVDFLLYSTFNHGSLEKPGYRCRLILPMHPVVTREQYQLIHDVVQRELLADVMPCIDKSSRLPWQQQRFWATKPDLVQHAFKFYRSESLVLDTEYWLDKARAYQTRKGVHHKIAQPILARGSGTDDSALTTGLRQALSQIPSRTRHFQSILMYTKALESVIDSYQLFHDWAWSDPEHQAAQEQKRDDYVPAVAWAKAEPLMPIQAAVGATHKLAREVATTNVKSDPALQQEASKQAATYLFVHHRKHFDKLWSELFCQDSSGGSSSGVNSKETA